jgi:hypothetical protein
MIPPLPSHTACTILGSTTTSLSHCHPTLRCRRLPFQASPQIRVFDKPPRSDSGRRGEVACSLYRVKETSGRFTIKRNQWKGSIFPKIYEIVCFNLIHLAEKSGLDGGKFSPFARFFNPAFVDKLMKLWCAMRQSLVAIETFPYCMSARTHQSVLHKHYCMDFHY